MNPGTSVNPSATGGPPVGSRGVLTEPSTGRPMSRGGPRNEVVDPARSSTGATAAPAQRSGQPMEATGPRGLPGREMRAPIEGATGEGRAARPGYGGSPYGGVREPAPVQTPPGAIPQGTIPQGTMPQRTYPPRGVDAPRPDAQRAAEGQRPAPANRPAEAAAVAPRPAAAVAPPAAPPAVVQRAPEARPPEAQRPPGGDGKMNRPEAPRGRGEERPQDKAEKQK